MTKAHKPLKYTYAISCLVRAYPNSDEDDRLFATRMGQYGIVFVDTAVPLEEFDRIGYLDIMEYLKDGHDVDLVPLFIQRIKYVPQDKLPDDSRIETDK